MTGFYRAFEDAHRGSREKIKHRLEVYIPFIVPLKSLYPECKGLDIGCGRGEWLETLIENGFSAQGVDLDAGMLAECELLGLPALQADALTFLKALPDESMGVISGFHFVEHIPFEVLQAIVKEALRVLKPAGLIIFETPNSENIVVATENFYLDPTHERPVPKTLLKFLTEYEGFERSKLLRLQENRSLYLENRDFDLMSVLSGVSPDYALIAQKSCPYEFSSIFDAPFEPNHGISLSDLSIRYDQAIASKFTVINQANINITERLDALATSNELINQANINAIDRLDAQATAIEQLKKVIEERDNLLQQLLRSTSWKITGPLRWAVTSAKKVTRFFVRNVRSVIGGAVRKLATRLAKYKVFRSVLNSLLKANPKLYFQLKNVAKKYGFLRTSGGTVGRSNIFKHNAGNDFESGSEPENLSRNAKNLFKKINEQIKGREDR